MRHLGGREHLTYEVNNSCVEVPWDKLVYVTSMPGQGSKAAVPPTVTVCFFSGMLEVSPYQHTTALSYPAGCTIPASRPCQETWGCRHLLPLMVLSVIKNPLYSEALQGFPTNLGSQKAD